MKWNRLYKEGRNYYYGDEDRPFKGIIAKKRDYADAHNDDCMYDEFLREDGDRPDLTFEPMSGHEEEYCTKYADMANGLVNDWLENEDYDEDIESFILDGMKEQTGDEWTFSEIHGCAQREWARVLHRVKDKQYLKSLEEDYYGIGDEYDCYDGKTGKYIVSQFIPMSMSDQTEEGILDACGYPKGTRVKIVD